MMKILKSLLVLTLLVFGLSAYSAVVLQINFDGSTGADIATYTPSTGDYPPGLDVSRYFNEPFVGAERHYGDCCQPSPVDTGNYPDIVTPPSPPGTGNQGGNVMFTALGTVADPTLHIGWYIDYNSGIVVTGDFTAEAVFAINQYMVAGSGSEWGLQNVFGNDMCPGSVAGGSLWKFRVWPNGGPIGGTGQIQLWTNDGGAEHDVDGPTVTVQTWHHAAAVYDDSADQIELFFDGTSYGTAVPNYPVNPQQTDWFLGDWPSNGAARGMAGWIDAVAISDTVLTPAGFRLWPTPVEDWMVY